MAVSDSGACTGALVNGMPPSDSVSVTLTPQDAVWLGKMLASNDPRYCESIELLSVDGFEISVELDSTWQRELQKGSAIVSISAPGASFCADLSRPVGRDLAAVLLGQSDVLVPVMAVDEFRRDAAGNPLLAPVYFVPTMANAIAVASVKKVAKKAAPVQRRTVLSRAARRSKARRRN